MHHALAMFQRSQQRLAQHLFLRRVYRETGNGQFDGVFFEPVQTWKAGGGQELTVDTQVGVATWPRPIRQLGINTFTVHHQGTEQADMLASVFAHQQSGQALGGLRLHRGIVVDAMLRS